MMNSLNSLFFNSSIKLFYNILFLFVGLLLTSFSSKQFHSLNDFQIIEKLKITSREKVYLHFDKPYYASGDDIWFKVYLVNADTHQQNAISKIVYVDLINFKNEIIESKKINIEKGHGFGDFSLDHRLETGEYLIRAYTNHMRNFDHGYFFRKSIQISSLLSINQYKDAILSTGALEKLNPDVQFLPEGGHMINGFHNRIGFKALGSEGHGIDIDGIIYDQHDNKIAAFKTSKFGMGLFNLIPEKNKSYHAEVNYRGRIFQYELPKAIERGISMQVREKEDYFQVNLHSSLKHGNYNFTLIGLQRGQLVSETKITELRKKIKINIPKSILESGIVQLTLVDQGQNPLCERLVFSEKETDQMDIDLKTSKKNYKKRELIEIDLSANHFDFENIKTDISLIVTDASVVNKEHYGLDIKSYLLLNSELKGVIENPGYYFKNDDPLRKRNLDILMLTQGWRKYLFAEKINDYTNQFEFDKGISFKGTIIKVSHQKEAVQAKVSLVIKENDQILYDKTETDLNGHFEFEDFDIKDNASIIIQVENVKRNDEFKSPKNQYRIEMDSIVEFDKPLVLYDFNTLQIAENDDSHSNDDFLERSKSFQSINAMIKDDKNRELLEEVVLEQVVEKTIREQKRIEYDRKLKVKTALYRDPSNRLDFSELGYKPWGNTLDALQNRIPGLSIIRDPREPFRYMVTIRGSASIDGLVSPMVLLNNAPVDINALVSIPASNIHFVDVLKGYKAAIYGSKAAGGIIIVYTKDGTEKFFDPKALARNGILNFTQPGSYKAREFYEPKYGMSKPEHKRPDYRTTLCWRPNVQFDNEGKAKISFYAADIPTNYRVDVQGITSEGTPITSETYIHVD